MPEDDPKTKNQVLDGKAGIPSEEAFGVESLFEQITVQRYARDERVRRVKARIHGAMERDGLGSVEQAAEKCGVERSTMFELLKGCKVSDATITKVARWAGLQPEELRVD